MKRVYVAINDGQQPPRVFASAKALLAQLCGVSWSDWNGTTEEYRGESSTGEKWVAYKVDFQHLRDTGRIKAKRHEKRREKRARRKARQKGGPC